MALVKSDVDFWGGGRRASSCIPTSACSSAAALRGMPMCDFTLTRCTRPERPAMAAAICRIRGAWGLATARLRPAR
eukprot:2112865-Rhodomonas_salina.1